MKEVAFEATHQEPNCGMEILRTSQYQDLWNVGIEFPLWNVVQ